MARAPSAPKEHVGPHSHVPLHPLVVEALRALPLPRTGPLFRLADDRQVASHNVSHAVNGHLHGLGIGKMCHALRHSFATQHLSEHPRTSGSPRNCSGTPHQQ